VEDIAEAAGVSVRTFSNYFTNKGQALPGEDLWEALAAATERGADVAWAAAPDDLDPDGLRRALSTWFGS
jgi:AcrR family transcriptional regulator